MSARSVLVMTLLGLASGFFPASDCLAGIPDRGFGDRKVGEMPLVYRWVKSYFIDVDQVLREQLGIGFESCRYISQVSNRISTFSGVGPCLFELLRESLGTPNRAGFVQATARDLTPAGDGGSSRAQVHVFWRPAHGAFFSNIYRLVRELVNPSQVKNEEDALWGTLVFHFPKGDGLNLVSNPAVRRALGAFNQPLEVFSISLFPVKEAEDPGIYQGMIFFFAHGASASDPIYQIYFKAGSESGKYGKKNYFVELDGD